MAALASQDDVAQDDLRAIVEEFITTERNYVAHLSGLLSVFMPLYMESGACASVSESLHRMLQDLFASWKQLHDFHRSLLLTIETRCLVGGSEVSASHVTASGSFSAVASPVKNPQTKPQMRGRGQDMSLRLKKSAANGLANVVKSLAPYFKLYSAYCRLYPQIVPLFADARNDNAEFNDVVRSYEQDPVTCGLNIESILVKPVQRVCKYELFLRDMGKKAAKTTDSNLQMDIVMALQITKQAVGHVNQKDKDTENLAKVAALHDQLRPMRAVNLLKAHMRLVLEANAMAVEVPATPAGNDMSDPFGLQTRDHLVPPRLHVTVEKGASDPDAPLHAPLSSVSAEPVHVFLLTDILILCRFKLKKKGMLRKHDKKRYHIAQIIPLHNARVSVIDTGRHALGLGTHALKLEWAKHLPEAAWFALSLPSAKDMDKWHDELVRLIPSAKPADVITRNQSGGRGGGQSSHNNSSGTAGRGGASTPTAGGGAHAPASRRFSRFSHTASTSSSSSTAVLISTDDDENGDGANAGQKSQHRPSASSSSSSSTGLSSGPRLSMPTTVRCYKCDQSLEIPDNAHVMSCQFCKQVFLYRAGRPVGKPVFHDGALDRLASRRFSFGSSAKTRYYVLTNSELSFYKTMDTFLTLGEASRKGAIPINATTVVDTDVGLGKGNILFTVQTRVPGMSDMQTEQLRAKTEVERGEWIASIHAVVATQQAQQHPAVQAAPSPDGAMVVQAPVVIPPGVDPEVFLSLPQDVQDQLLRECGMAMN